jgi:hypothetical protein
MNRFLVALLAIFCLCPGPWTQAADDEPCAHLRVLEDKWEKALFTHDSSVAREVLADDFLGISSQGKKLTKEESMKNVTDDTSKYSVAGVNDFNCKLMADNLAITTGIWHEIGTDDANKPFENRFRFMDVWQKRQEDWLCIASDVSLLPKNP